MKGLLIKDFYMLWKQSKFMILIIIIYVAIGAWKPENSFWTTISTLFMAMLPVRTLGMDERCKWDQYTLMLPCSRKDMVLEKYILGLLGIIGVVLVYGGLTFILQPLEGSRSSLFQIGQIIVLMLSFPCLFMGINMPFVFRYGVEKGRMWFALFTAIIFSGYTFIMKAPEQLEGSTSAIESMGIKNGVMGTGIGLPLLAGSITFLLLSMLLSVRIYERREL